jgi:Uma2 family endonuclease
MAGFAIRQAVQRSPGVVPVPLGGLDQTGGPYNWAVGATIADFRESIEHLSPGAAVVIYQIGWDEYERLVDDLLERPGFRVSYDDGRLEVMTPLPKHEEYGRFIDALVRAVAEALDVDVQNYGSATWKNRRLRKGVEPDACYYVAHAAQTIGKQRFDLDVDPAPDIVVEIDVTNESLSKFPIYAALRVGEIWWSDGDSVRFHALDGDVYRETAESPSLPGLTPAMLATALAESRAVGQSKALRAFRERWREAQSRR